MLRKHVRYQGFARFSAVRLYPFLVNLSMAFAGHTQCAASPPARSDRTLGSEVYLLKGFNFEGIDGIEGIAIDDFNLAKRLVFAAVCSPDSSSAGPLPGGAPGGGAIHSCDGSALVLPSGGI